MISDDEARKLAEAVIETPFQGPQATKDADKLARKLIELLDRQRWIPWTGKYEKQFYDVWVKGRFDVVMHCWPNNGVMMTVDGSGRSYRPNQCAGIRVSEFQTLPQPLGQP
jgi:hypothetical protein